MKKTLLLIGLLGLVPAGAETVAVFTDGYSTENYRSAYDYAMVGKMCWGANAANIISWWQDQLEEQGYNLPQGTPTKTDVFTEYRAGLNEYRGGYPDSAVEWWLDGYYAGTSNNDPNHTGAFYKDVLQPMEHNIYNNTGTMIKQFFPATYGSRKALSQAIVDSLNAGYALIVDIGSTSVTMWGADYDTETGLLTSVYYSDPHWATQVWHSTLTFTTDAVDQETFYIAGTGTMAALTGISCHIENYLTETAYTDTGNGCFAPVYNVAVNSGAEYTLNKALQSNDVVKGDVTISNGTVTVTGEGAAAGAVIFAASETEGAARTLSVQRTGLEIGEVQVNAAADNVLNVTAGKDVTISAMSGEGLLTKTGEGVLTNGGALGDIELQAGTLKGSGSFGKVTVNGGTLVVGNSPGHQVYTDMLTVTDGELVFCVAGWEQPNDGSQLGWESATYSTIDMQGHDFTVGASAELVIAVSEAAAATLTLGGGSVELTLVNNMGNVLTEAELTALAERTTFVLTDELAVTLRSGVLEQPKFSYAMAGNNLVLRVIPEPTAAVLSLSALAGLAARRRRKRA